MTVDTNGLAEFIARVYGESGPPITRQAIRDQPSHFELEARLRARYQEVAGALANLDALTEATGRAQVALRELAALRRDFPDGAGIIGRSRIAPPVYGCDPDTHPLYDGLRARCREVVSDCATLLDHLYETVGDYVLDVFADTDPAAAARVADREST